MRASIDSGLPTRHPKQTAPKFGSFVCHRYSQESVGLQVVHIPCGPFANASEIRAYREVDNCLRQAGGSGTAYILTNLTHPNPQGQADEIDMVVIGPGGAVVVEVKHWDAAALRRNANVDHSAELITAKAKRVAGRLRAIDRRMEFVPGSMLFTRETNSLRRNGRQAEHLGIRIYALKDVSALLEIPARDGPCPSERLASTLAPRQMAGASVSPRRFRVLTNSNYCRLQMTPSHACILHGTQQMATG